MKERITNAEITKWIESNLDDKTVLNYKYRISLNNRDDFYDATQEIIRKMGCDLIRLENENAIIKCNRDILKELLKTKLKDVIIDVEWYSSYGKR